MKKVAIGLTAILLTACNSTAPTVQTQNISMPQLETTNIATLGERMLMQAKGFSANSVTVSSGEGYGTRLSAGKYCERSKGSNRYYSDNNQAIGLKNGYGQVISYSNFITYNRRKNEVCAATMSCYSSNEISIKFTPNDYCLAQDSLQQVIEYNGRSGKVLNFTYREFSGDMIRNSYTTDFTVDLEHGDMVMYKGAQIKIESATNSQIKYKLIKNFNTLL